MTKRFIPVIIPDKVYRNACMFFMSEPEEKDLSRCLTFDVVEYIKKERKHLIRFKIPNIEHALILRDALDERIRVWRKNLSKRIGRKR